MGIKFLTARGGGSLEGAIKSIDYATQMGVDVMSNSWGGGGFSEELKNSIIRAKEAGILFTAAAGNSRQNNDARPTYPATYDVDNIVAVAAVDSRGQLASFSSYGATTVDVAAPGVNVLSTTPDGLKSWSGTSMATPHVSGCRSSSSSQRT
jgi:thermitase